MRRPLSQRKCQHCQTFFDPHPRTPCRQKIPPAKSAKSRVVWLVFAAAGRWTFYNTPYAGGVPYDAILDGLWRSARPCPVGGLGDFRPVCR
jgi:hypothetical protein